MSKIMIEDVSRDLKWSLDGVTLSSAVATLNDLIKEYGEAATIDIGEEYADSYSDNQYAYLKIRWMREETNAEYEKRTGDAAKRQREIEAAERKEFERLQAKYGNPP